MERLQQTVEAGCVCQIGSGSRNIGCGKCRLEVVLIAKGGVVQVTEVVDGSVAK
jgi:hypothetical protein